MTWHIVILSCPQMSTWLKSALHRIWLSQTLSLINMIKTLLIVCLYLSAVLASPAPAKPNEESRELEVLERGLLEDLLINTIRDMVINQINNILGITTTTTPCGGLIGGGLLCPWITINNLKQLQTLPFIPDNSIIFSITKWIFGSKHNKINYNNCANRKIYHFKYSTSIFRKHILTATI